MIILNFIYKGHQKKNCFDVPCYNNAKCVDKYPGYKCKCKNGYTGKQCQDKPGKSLLNTK